jgi:hypothetical protein
MDQEVVIQMTTTSTPAEARTAKPRVVASAWRAFAIVVAVLLLGACAGLVFLWQGGTGTDNGSFPIGTLEDPNGQVHVTFNEDGTGRWFEVDSWEVPISYTVQGNLFTETTFDYPSGVQVPATYYWDYRDGQLTFRLWGEDPRPHRLQVYTGGPYTLVE